MYMSIIKKVLRKIIPSKQARRVKPWSAINGDKTLRLNYNLDENSVVFDLGGYEGQWASDIFSKYQCSIFIFEPFKKYAENIRERFAKNKNIKTLDFGLGKEDNQFIIYANDDSTSVFKKDGKSSTIEIKKASNSISHLNISHIDLMKINIEGGEYDLLDELIASNSIIKISNIQIQFHDFVPNAQVRMKEIQHSLSRTHLVTYSYEFVWENWELKK
jgi:FkbM family methyltransferase